MAPPEVFSFAGSPNKQAPLEGLGAGRQLAGTPNGAWLSLDLLEGLCQLAGAGHADGVRRILEAPMGQCPELLLLGLAQIKVRGSCSFSCLSSLAFLEKVSFAGCCMVISL